MANDLHDFRYQETDFGSEWRVVSRFSVVTEQKSRKNFAKITTGSDLKTYERRDDCLLKAQ